MSQNIGGFGLQVALVASATYPVGISITQFADDVDPFDLPELEIADKAMGLNGDLVTWSKAVPTDITLAVIPGTGDDDNLSVLAANNRVGRGKLAANDTIQLTAIYPSGRRIILTQGRLTKAPPASSVASSSRLKSKQYTFTFENIATTAGLGS